MANTSYFGGIYTGSNAWFISQDEGLKVGGSSEYPNLYCTSLKKINFSLYNKVDVTGYTSRNTGESYALTLGKCEFQVNTSSGGSSSTVSSNFSQFTSNKRFNHNKGTYTYDISKITGEGYLGFHAFIGSFVDLILADVRLY